MIKADIDSLNKWLQSKDFVCTVLEKSEACAVDRVLVDMQYEEDEYPMILQIALLEQDLSEADEIYKLKEKEKAYQLVDFYMNFPFEADPELAGDLMGLVTTLDHGFDLPGLKYHPGRKQVLYQYRYFATQGLLDTRILVTVLSFVELITVAFAPTVIALGTGKKSLKEALEEIKDLTREE